MKDFTVTGEDLRALIAPQTPPAVSIYMPTHEGGPEIRKDPPRLKGLLRKAEDAIGDKRRARSILAPAWELIDGDGAEWRQMRMGLAIFGSAETQRRFKLSERVEPSVNVGRRFVIRPLLASAGQERRFCLLAVDQQGPQLYEGDRTELRPVQDRALSVSVDAIMEETDLAADLGYHGSGSGRATYHALGEAPEDYKQAVLERYAMEIAKAVAPHLGSPERPLAVMAEPNLLGMLKSRIDYPEALTVWITKSPAGQSVPELHARAAEAVAPVVDATRRRWIEAAGERAPRQASDDPQTILLAAAAGRVAALLLDRTASVWGRWDPERHAVEIHAEPGAESEDLVEAILHETLRHNGEIHFAQRAELPGGASLAGVFRY